MKKILTISFTVFFVFRGDRIDVSDAFCWKYGSSYRVSTLPTKNNLYYVQFFILHVVI